MMIRWLLADRADFFGVFGGFAYEHPAISNTEESVFFDLLYFFGRPPSDAAGVRFFRLVRRSGIRSYVLTAVG